MVGSSIASALGQIQPNRLSRGTDQGPYPPSLPKLPRRSSWRGAPMPSGAT